ncbi:MAG: alpha/beta hydrolase, partial [Cyanobacteria bacterium P01_H01_bin.121]
VWQAWQPWFERQQIEFLCCDRGYFGTPHYPDFAEAVAERWLLVHSYGLHLCPAKQLEQADRLIIFSSFLAFHPTELTAQRHSKRRVNAMVRQLPRQPEAVLLQFWANTFEPSEAAWANTDADYLPRANWSLLQQDLESLNVAGLQLDPQIWPAKILILHGTEDRIVPLAMGQRLAELIKSQAVAREPHDSVQFQALATVGHALPLTHTAIAQTILEAWLAAS